MSKIAGVEFLKEQLIAVERERKELQDAVARLPQLDAEVQAIKLLLAKHAGDKHRLPVTVPVAKPAAPINGEPSLAQLVVRALTEAGKPQNTAQLLGFLASHGKSPARGTLRSTIHQRGKLFKSVSPGVYGLVEWQQ